MLRRKARVRATVGLHTELPRLTVFRSLRHISAQIIDDVSGKTLVATTDIIKDIKGKKSEKAAQVGTQIAKLALAKKITKVRFDRGAYRYHGRIAALADAARAEGLQF